MYLKCSLRDSEQTFVVLFFVNLVIDSGVATLLWQIAVTTFSGIPLIFLRILIFILRELINRIFILKQWP